MFKLGYILVADDNTQISSILAEYIKKEGYIPLIANNGSEAISKFKEFIKISAESFGKNLSDITRTVIDKAKDTYETTKDTVVVASENAKVAIIKGSTIAAEVAGEVAEKAKINAESAINTASDFISETHNDIQQRLRKDNSIKQIEHDKNERK